MDNAAENKGLKNEASEQNGAAINVGRETAATSLGETGTLTAGDYNEDFGTAGGDNELEPGELVTPPPHCLSPASRYNSPIPSISSKKQITVPNMGLEVNFSSAKISDIDLNKKRDNETKNSQTKFFSQSSKRDAQVCEEKVRAILELDAIKRKEEAERKKQELERKRLSGELEKEEEEKRKEKEKRKRLKRLEKEQRTARLALMSDEDNVQQSNETRKKSRRKSEDRESGERDSSSSESIEHPILGLASAPNQMPSLRFPTVPPHYGEHFVPFRPAGPFVRGVRPEFHRGGSFMPRGRGNMRGNASGMRFPGFRPHFFPNNNNIRHYAPNANLRQHSSPPPTQNSSNKPAPLSTTRSSCELMWTKTMPKISFAFKCVPSPENKKDEHEISKEIHDNSTVDSKSKEKRHKKLSKPKEILRKSRKKADKTSKKRADKLKKSSEKSKHKKSRKRKREKSKKVKKSLVDEKLIKAKDSKKNSSSENLNKTQENQRANDEPPKKRTKLADGENERNASEKSSNSKVTLSENNLKTKPEEETTQIQNIDPADILYVNDNHRETNEKSILTAVNENAVESKHQFDMFADSPPRPFTVSVFNDIKNSVGSKKEDVQSENNKDLRAHTPPIEGLIEKSDLLSTPEKSHLQKALEMQRRIGKLLQDDELNLENIEATKERLMLNNMVKNQIQAANKNAKPKPQVEIRNNEKRKDSRDSSIDRTRGKSQNLDECKDKSKSSRHRSRSKEKVNISNNSRSNRKDDRSKSRERFRSNNEKRFKSRSRSRSLSRLHANNFKSKDDSRKDDHRKTTQSPSRSRRRSRSHSVEKHKNKYNAVAVPKVESTVINSNSKKRKEEADGPKIDASRSSTETDNQTKISTTSKVKSKKRERQVSNKPLSFSAAEFLFPEEEDRHSDRDDKFENNLKFLSSRTSPLKTKTSASNAERFGKSSSSQKDRSPDSDEYIDNWESDSNATMESSSVVYKTEIKQEETSEHKLRNPASSTPKKNDTEQSTNIKTSSACESTTPPRIVDQKTEIQVKPKNEKLFAMQDIYDQFIKSVQEAGIDLKTGEGSDVKTENVEENVVRKVSTSETSRAETRLSSATSTSTNTSTSSSANTSSSSSSSSDSSASSSDSSSSSSSPTSFDENSNDIDMENAPTIVKLTTSSPQPSNKIISPVAVTPPNASTDIRVSPPKKLSSTSTPPSTPTTTPTKQPTKEGTQTQTPGSSILKSDKSQMAKDLKKLRSLENNLSRMATMRANYDPTDEISGELLKMEKLFLAEKNLILQKYAKSSLALIDGEYSFEENQGGNNDRKTVNTNEVVRASVEHGKSSPCRNSTMVITDANQGTNKALHLENAENIDVRSSDLVQEDSAATAESCVNKIFDSNREAIKLTITPSKLTKTPTVFDRVLNDEKLARRSSDASEEADFTEALIKPVKEIAIVKPLMGSKDTRGKADYNDRGSLNRMRSPYRGERDRSKRTHSRSRSHSHSRLSPRRSSIRAERSRSISPKRSTSRTRNSAYRQKSPRRRGPHTPQPRYRSSRRSRSRSRSRSPNRVTRRSDYSPHSKRRRHLGGQSGGNIRFQKRDSKSYSRSRSRTPTDLHRLRPRSPPMPHSLGHRRSYSRSRFSRSPLPFKPPSPPMVRSRSYSMSPSSPRKPRSPRSPLSPRYSRSRSPSISRYGESGDLRHRRSNSYDAAYGAHSPDRHRNEYYGSELEPDISDPSYYYDPNSRMTFDTRINIVVEGPGSNINAAHHSAYHADSYGNYSQFSTDGNVSAYMSMPHFANSNDYYAHHQYIPQDAQQNAQLPPHAPQHMYSNVSHECNPLIQPQPNCMGGGNVHLAPAHSVRQMPGTNFYYDEYGRSSPSLSEINTSNHQSGFVPTVGPPPTPALIQHDVAQQQYHSAANLKELPKVTVAVQKGNVLEIVPSETSESTSSSVASTANQSISENIPEANAIPVPENLEQAVKPKKSNLIKDEINKRLAASISLKEQRKGDASKVSILRKSTETKETVDEITEDKEYLTTPSGTTQALKPSKPKSKKKVLFEDGVFPNYDSDTDSKTVIQKLRSKIRKLRKDLGPSALTMVELLANAKLISKKSKKIDPKFAKLPPPPPPTTPSQSHVDQPISNRPPTPLHLYYFHYDDVVKAMYTSPTEVGVPPRLVCSKNLPQNIPLTANAINSPITAAHLKVGIGRLRALSPLQRALSPKPSPPFRNDPLSNQTGIRPPRPVLIRQPTHIPQPAQGHHPRFSYNRNTFAESPIGISANSIEIVKQPATFQPVNPIVAQIPVNRSPYPFVPPNMRFTRPPLPMSPLARPVAFTPSNISSNPATLTSIPTSPVIIPTQSQAQPQPSIFLPPPGYSIASHGASEQVIPIPGNLPHPHYQQQQTPVYHPAPHAPRFPQYPGVVTAPLNQLPPEAQQQQQQQPHTNFSLHQPIITASPQLQNTVAPAMNRQQLMQQPAPITHQSSPRPQSFNFNVPPMSSPQIHMPSPSSSTPPILP